MSKLSLFIKKYYKYLVIISILLAIIFLYVSFDYLFIFRKVFLYIFITLLFIYIIGLILLCVYKEYDNKAVGIIGSIITIISTIIFIVFSFILFKINININNTYDNDEYYTKNICISYYLKNHTYESIDDLKDIDLKIGVISNDDEDYFGISKLDDLFNNYKINEYEDNFSLFKDLINGKVDVGVFTSDYKLSVSTNSDITYVKYLNDVYDLYTFEEKIKDNKKSLDDNSFNILLIGYAPENEEETIGYADSIMVASVNLDSLYINLTSIPRSSEVRFACRGNIRDRINETIIDSEKCLLDTSSDLLDTDIDYYIEINFNGLVKIVDAIGGIDVNSSVEFVGQTSSANRGTKTVYVPSGEYVRLNGEQALAFARERSVYSSSDDLTRQDNQKQVLLRIIQKLIENKDIGQYLNIIDILSDNVKTNISKKDMLNILDTLTSLKDNTSISLYDKFVFSKRQLVGKYVDSYSYYLRSPMSIYKLYDKSINDTKDRINTILANYKERDIKQATYQYFSIQYPIGYSLQDLDFSSETLSEEIIPNYYPLLIGESLEYAQNWANDNNVKLTIEYIDSNDDLYNEDKKGEIIYQSVSYGSLVDENDACVIKVIAND